MGEPTAAFLMTARDATGGAIASADKNFKSLQRTVSSVRTLFAGFGVALSGRVFFNWISGALEARDLTEKQAESIKEAKEALEGMRGASDELARSLAISLIPAMQTVSAVLIGWNRIFANADPFPFEKQIEDLRDQIKGIEKEAVDAAREFGDTFAELTPDQQARIDALKKQIEELKIKQINFDPGAEERLKQKLAELTSGLTKLDINNLDNVLGLRRKPRIELEAVIDPTSALQEIAIDPPEIPVALQLDAMPEMQTAIAEAKNAWAEFGESTSYTLRGYFSDVFMGVETSFKDLLKRMVSDLASSALVEGLGSVFSGGSSGIAKFLGGLFGGSRANEGPVSAGKIYKVHPGEAFFAPSMNGSVNHMAGAGAGNVQVNNYLTVNATGDPKDAERRFSTAMKQQSDATVARVKQLIDRRRL